MESDTQVHSIQNTSFPCNTTAAAVPLKSSHYCPHLKACRRGGAVPSGSCYCCARTCGRLCLTPYGESNLKQEVGNPLAFKSEPLKPRAVAVEWVSKPTGMADSWLHHPRQNTDTLYVGYVHRIRVSDFHLLEICVSEQL